MYSATTAEHVDAHTAGHKLAQRPDLHSKKGFKESKGIMVELKISNLGKTMYDLSILA